MNNIEKLKYFRHYSLNSPALNTAVNQILIQNDQIDNLTAQVKVLMDEVEDLKRELKQIKTAPVTTKGD